MKSELPFIQIYILSRDRYQSLIQTLESCLAIQYPNFEIIVSDNSTNEEVCAGLQNHPLKNRFKFIRRESLKYFNQHINLIKSEIVAPYFILFHDDDLMLPNCLSVYSEIMIANPSVGACAGNTKMIYRGVKSENLYSTLRNVKILCNSDDFLRSYYGESHGHPPFPFYMYRTEVVRGIDVIYQEGLIHSDGPFIFKIMKKAGIVWSPEIVGYYHIHETNISRLINIRALNSMYHFYLKQTGDRQKVVYRYLYRNRLRYYMQNRGKFVSFLSHSRKRKLIILTFLFVIKNCNFYFRKLISRGRHRGKN